MDGQRINSNKIKRFGALDLLRTRGSWVRILPGAPKIKDLEAKTRSSFLLWDLCGTSYPPVPTTASRFMHLARKTRCSSVPLEFQFRNVSRLIVRDA